MNFVRISHSFTLFFFSNLYLLWNLAGFHCCVSADLHLFDSLTERYLYIDYIILTSQIYSSAVNRGC